MGSWITYGLGSENEDLPGFVVLISSGGTDPTGGKALWSSGFLPSVYQGVQCRSKRRPDPLCHRTQGHGPRRSAAGASTPCAQLNEIRADANWATPRPLTRISQYELAFRMQIVRPRGHGHHAASRRTILEDYGAAAGGSSFANNCLLARRLVEQGVRYVQLYDWGWDIHGTGPGDDIVDACPKKCREIDRPVAALIKDLKQRGLLDETLVIWGGEFGRTSMNEARGGSQVPRPRPPPALLHASGWPAAASRGA